MLQRAASNAYSWWWASHIRTKQSKWLEQNLQDMEEKVEIVLKLIEEDGDSFAKRAEMYYRKRPEITSFVEESYRAYRALAERYDHISTELQNANNTIASVFPEQVQFSIDEEDEKASSGVPRRSPELSRSTNVPIAPKGPAVKEFRRNPTMEASAASKSLARKKTMKGIVFSAPKSGLKKPEALEEIDRVQKLILGLQTEKEFVKSSYENGVAKFWEIESRIKEMQERVSALQDEFGEGISIEDGEARNLMAGAALRSCQEKLAFLQDKQQRSNEEAVLESRRIREVREKLERLKDESRQGDPIDEEREVSCGTSEGGEEEEEEEEEEELESLRAKIKQQFEAKSSSDFTVAEMVEKIDELVSKVISLETAVSSQAALVERLKGETDELQAQLRSLESDKAEVVAGGGLRLKAMEEKLGGIQILDKSFKDQKNNLQLHFTEANCNLDHLSDKLKSVKPDEEEETLAEEFGFVNQLDVVNPFVDFPSNRNPFEEFEESRAFDSEEKIVTGASGSDQQRGFLQPKDDLELICLADLGPKEEAKGELEESKEEDEKLVGLDDLGLKKESKLDIEESKEEDHKLVDVDDLGSKEEAKREVEESKEEDQKLVDVNDSGPKEETKREVEESEEEEDQKLVGLDDLGPKEEARDDLGPKEEVKRELEDEPDWQKLFTKGMENREKILLTEYTSALRNYKDLKKRLGEAEKRNRDGIFESAIQMKELKSSNAKKDEEIRSLRLKLGLLEDSLNEKDQEEREREQDEEEEDIKTILTEQEPAMSATEEKFRTNIDELLEQNLDFWLRFSGSFHVIQKFDTEVEDLKSEIKKLQEKKRKSGLEKSNSLRNLLKSDARPLYKHLREIQTELSVWLEKSALLRDELGFRFGSLCEIQEEITRALRTSAEGDEFKFTSYQAAKFQGEVLNMKQENNKVADELEAGIDHVSAMGVDVERTLVGLNDEFELAGPTKKKVKEGETSSGSSSSSNNSPSRLRSNSRSSSSRNRIPLRSFIFGVRSKKQKASIFSLVAPAISRKYHGTKSGPLF